MDFFNLSIDVHPIILVAVAFVISFFTSVGGISGAFLLLPFQVSVLRFVSPAVSSTNLLFNVLAIPGGVYQYFKEGRMAWPLTCVIIAGSLPGIFFGALIRIKYLPDPRAFKFFVGWVMLYIGYRLVVDMIREKGPGHEKLKALDDKFKRRAAEVQELKKSKFAAGLPPGTAVKTVSLSLSKVEYSFFGETFHFNPLTLFFMALVVGVVGGIYGIGGGAIIAPFIVTFFRLPIYTIAGATLMGTFVSSVAGVIFYLVIAGLYSESGMAIAPNWSLGFLFGIGGFAGIYCGARAQKFVPEKIIKAILAVLLFFLALRYIVQFFI
jgi:uncharacterized membrane protein YfcA